MCLDTIAALIIYIYQSTLYSLILPSSITIPRPGPGGGEIEPVPSTNIGVLTIPPKH